MAKTSGGTVAAHAVLPKGDAKGGTERDILRSQITADAGFNSRKHSDGTKDGGSMDELISSIRLHGLIQPIVVRPTEAGKYTVVAGFRRFAATEALGWNTVRCSVKNMTEKEARLANLTENVTREDLFPGELADACHTLRTEHRMSGTDLATALGKPGAKSYVNKLLAMRDELDPRIWLACMYCWAAPMAQADLFELRKDEKDHARQWAKFCERTGLSPDSVAVSGANGQGGTPPATPGATPPAGPGAQPEKAKAANQRKLAKLREDYLRLRKEAKELGVELTDADKLACAEYAKILAFCMNVKVGNPPLHAKLEKASKARDIREAAARERDAAEE